MLYSLEQNKNKNVCDSNIIIIEYRSLIVYLKRSPGVRKNEVFESK